MTALILARIQFAFTITFHIIWPAINVGLVIFLVIIEIMWLRTKNDVYEQIYKFWSKIFALSFGMGVVTGIVMSYQFGSIFGKFSVFAAPVIGPLLGTEVLAAFFLEAVFLGVMLFGWGRVPRWFHMLATSLVAVGVHNSVLWIIIVASWMHTPAGVVVENGHLIVTSFTEVIFNPSTIDRLCHMLGACYISACLFVMGISAYYILKGRMLDFAKRTFSVCLVCMSLLVPLMLYLGDSSGLVAHKYQPLKVAAIEGLWDTTAGAPTLLFAWPDMKTEKNLFAFGIPYGTSFILTRDPYGVIRGLKEWDKADRPNVPLVFYSFRVMVGIWSMMMLALVYALFLTYKRRLFESKLLMYVHMFLTPMGVVATIAGWYVAEIGRQPWVIYNIMRTKDAVSTGLNYQVVLWSLIMFVTLDIIIFIAYLRYIRKVIKLGPAPLSTQQIEVTI